MSGTIFSVQHHLKPRPSLSPNFVPRNGIMERMYADLLNDTSDAVKRLRVGVLTGPGGAGKTQLAVKFVMDFEDR